MKKTSWGPFALWYDELLEKEGTYQKDLILPNLLRLLNIRKGESVLDIACGQGFFAREFYKAGAKVTGIDISEELIEIAEKRSPLAIKYYAAQAQNIQSLANSSCNKITMILVGLSTVLYNFILKLFLRIIFVFQELKNGIQAKKASLDQSLMQRIKPGKRSLYFCL